MAKCKNCKHLKIDSSIEKKICFLVGDIGNPDEEISCCCFRQATNADRIRSMTDEELAELLDEANCIIECSKCDEPTSEWGSCIGDCKKPLLRWLKSEVGCE